MKNLLQISDKVDVLVAGAGPAGLTAALRLLAAGASVLLVDARKKIGSPLRCGEISANVIFEIMGLEPRPSWVRCRLDRKPGNWIVLNRELWEFEVSKIIEQRGGTVLTETPVVGVGNYDGVQRHVILRSGRTEKTVRARCIVAADGVSSMVARYAGIDTYLHPNRTAPGLAYRFVDAEVANPHETHREPLPRSISPFPHYFWVIPNEPGAANVGLYLPGIHGLRARALLDHMIKNTNAIKGGRIVQTVVGVVSEAPPLDKPYSDGILVAGGAARLVDPLSGGGITSAVASGDIAGRLVGQLGSGSMDKAALAPYRQQLESIYQLLSRRWETMNRILSNKQSTPDAVRRSLLEEAKL